MSPGELKLNSQCFSGIIYHSPVQGKQSLYIPLGPVLVSDPRSPKTKRRASQPEEVARERRRTPEQAPEGLTFQAGLEGETHCI